jgi:hypothetical protein
MMRLVGLQSCYFWGALRYSPLALTLTLSLTCKEVEVVRVLVLAVDSVDIVEIAVEQRPV